MKKISLFLILLMAIIAIAMQTDSAPEFKFVEETHDFGKIPLNKPVSVDFTFTNTGTQPLIISTVEPTCGCTIAKFTSKPVLKGKKGSITLTFNAGVVGVFNKGITVKSNAKTPVKVLILKGEVFEPVKATSK